MNHLFKEITRKRLTIIKRQ